jgi:transcriptional regulator with XRE-family HTH domain
MELLHAFGNTLKQIRKKKSWSQEELADHSGLDRTYISLLERGLRNPTLSTIFSLANCLDYQPHQLIQEIEKALKPEHGSDLNEN